MIFDSNMKLLTVHLATSYHKAFIFY